MSRQIPYVHGRRVDVVYFRALSNYLACFNLASLSVLAILYCPVVGYAVVHPFAALVSISNQR